MLRKWSLIDIFPGVSLFFKQINALILIENYGKLLKSSYLSDYSL